MAKTRKNNLCSDARLDLAGTELKQRLKLGKSKHTWAPILPKGGSGTQCCGHREMLSKGRQEGLRDKRGLKIDGS